MRRDFLARLLVAGLVFLLMARAQGEVDSNLVARMAPEGIFPALQAEAQARRIPLSGIDAFASNTVLRVGDSVTALIALHEKKNRRTQWLLRLVVIPAPAGAGKEPDKPAVFYSSTGHRYEFAPEAGKARAEIIGPCAEPSAGKEGSKLKDAINDIAVNQGFLGLGFDEGAAFAMREEEARRRNKNTNQDFHFGVADRPFDHATVLAESNRAARLNVTTNEERSMVGWVPATMTYFETAMNYPGLEGILMKVVRMPSLWSMVKDRGVTVFIGFDTEDVTRFPVAGWQMPADTPAYAVPWAATLNNREALDVTLIVTAARPPLLTCAGILGFLAEDPEDSSKYLTVRVISAKAAK